jgi:hypothetical protein
VTTNSTQFNDNIWDTVTERMRADAVEYPPDGRMPVHEMRQRMDPVFQTWDHFTTSAHGYISNLADHVKREGVINPVILDEQGMIYDGHHRTAAAEMLGHEDVPWRHIRREIPTPRGDYRGPGRPA